MTDPSNELYLDFGQSQRPVKEFTNLSWNLRTTICFDADPIHHLWRKGPNKSRTWYVLLYTFFSLHILWFVFICKIKSTAFFFDVFSPTTPTFSFCICLSITQTEHIIRPSFFSPRTGGLFDPCFTSWVLALLQSQHLAKRLEPRQDGDRMCANPQKVRQGTPNTIFFSELRK